jgi:tRNA(fMet)-specific endonuclease VapC
MLILDTNHYSEIERRSRPGQVLEARLIAAKDEAFITIVTPEEVLKGWMAVILPHRHSDHGVRAYADFHRSLEGFRDWFILPWSEDSASIFARLKESRLHVGTKDLCIASIALEYEATILTRNLVDFAKVPGLKVENWLD